MTTQDIGPVNLFVLDVVRLAKAETGVAALVAGSMSSGTSGMRDMQMQMGVAK